MTHPVKEEKKKEEDRDAIKNGNNISLYF